MRYYLFNLQSEDFTEDLIIPKLNVKFNSIELKNDFDEKVLIENRKVKLLHTNQVNRFLLFVEDKEVDSHISFDFLFDEEFEIFNFNIDLTYDGYAIDYEWIPKEVFTEEELYEEFIDSLDFYKKNTICIEGHRPNDMWGYDIELKQYKDLAKKVAERLERFVLNDNITQVMTGSDLGFDTVSFFAVEYLKKNGYPNLKNTLVIPFININKKWNEVDKKRFERMKFLADYIIYTDKIRGYTVDLVSIGEYHELKQNKKSFFMIDNSKMILTNWNERSGYIQNCIAYAIKKGIINININKE